MHTISFEKENPRRVEPEEERVIRGNGGDQHSQLRAIMTGVALGIMIGCTTASAQTKEVRFGLPVAAINSGYCMFPAATRLGYFAEEGLSVKINNIAGSTSVVQTVLSGRIDIGAATPEPLFKSNSQGDRLVLVYNYIRHPTGSVAVPADSPIKTLADLRGKKIGAQSLASGNILLTNGLLSKAGLNPATDVSYLSVGVGAQALQALRSGHVDALVLFDSLYAQMEVMGAKLRYLYGEGQEKLFSTQFLVKPETIEQNSAMIAGFGRAVAKATLFAKENPEACVRMLWQEFPASRIPGMAESEQLANDVAILTKRMEILLPPDKPGQGWGYYDPESITAWINFALEGGVIDKKIENPDSVYTNRFVPEFNKYNKADVIAKAKAWKP